MINTVKKIYSKITSEFSSYQVTYKNSNIETLVPLDEANTDYQAIQEWIAQGNQVIDNGA